MKTIIYFITALALFAVCACAPAQPIKSEVPAVSQQAQSATNTPDTATPVASASETNSDTVTFTDDLGREVSVPKNPKRAAALIGSFADMWALAGGELAAAPEDAWKDFNMDLPDAVNIGGNHSPSLELLLDANPDFVIASSVTPGNVDLKEALESTGIPVAYFEVTNFEDYLSTLNILTDITGNKDLYEKNGVALKNQIEEIKKNYADFNVPSEQKKVLLLRAASNGVKAKDSQGTVMGQMLYDMGLENIADDNNGGLLENLSPEAVMAAQPYRIFVITMGDDLDAANTMLKNLMDENLAWGKLDAVEAGRMHVMDKSLFNLKPNARWPEAYEVLFEILTQG